MTDKIPTKEKSQLKSEDDEASGDTLFRTVENWTRARQLDQHAYFKGIRELQSEKVDDESESPSSSSSKVTTAAPSPELEQTKEEKDTGNKEDNESEEDDLCMEAPPPIIPDSDSSNGSNQQQQDSILRTLADVQAKICATVTTTKSERFQARNDIPKSTSNSKEESNKEDKDQLPKLSPNRPFFGRFLDAGTGTSSLEWARLHCRTQGPIHAVTASQAMRHDILTKLGPKILSRSWTSNSDAHPTKPPYVALHVGNWMDKDDLRGVLSNNSSSTDTVPSCEKFDTILADYLIGAVDGFSPFCQSEVLKRVCKHLRIPPTKDVKEDSV